MQETNVFDEMAGTYDDDFSNTMTGIAQRNRIHRYLRRRISEGWSVLEINCGTGIDAFFLSSNRCKVLATDASEKMISQCHEKLSNYHEKFQPEFRVLAFNELTTLNNEEKSNLIFSNFSGLNCVNNADMLELPAIFHSRLKQGASLIMVLFGKKCLWEKLYMLLKGRFNQINRRKSASLIKLPNDADFRIYYYSPDEIRQIFSGYFKLIDVKPVGLFIAPSYLDPFFRRKKLLFKTLEFFEQVTGNLSFLSDFSDHYIIEMKSIEIDLLQ